MEGKKDKNEVITTLYKSTLTTTQPATNLGMYPLSSSLLPCSTLA